MLLKYISGDTPGELSIKTHHNYGVTKNKNPLTAESSTYENNRNSKLIPRLNTFFTHDHPLSNLPPRGKERSFPPWGKLERGSEPTKNEDHDNTERVIK